MPKRTPNHRLVKRHRTYAVDEIAALLGSHRNTVRNWLKGDLQSIDDRRPVLVHGAVLFEFLRDRRAQRKRPCSPGEIYCFRCRNPRRPAGNVVVYQARTVTSGDLVGSCVDCGSRMYRRVSMAKLTLSLGGLDIRNTDAEEHIDESLEPSPNCDFDKENPHHG